MFRHARANFIICAADNVLTFHVSSPHPLIVLDCMSFIVYCSPYSHTVLEADGHVHTVTCLPPFNLFPHTGFYTFSHLRVPFFSFLLFLPYFFHHTFPLFPSLRALLSSPPTLFFCALHETQLSLFKFSFVLILTQRHASYIS